MISCKWVSIGLIVILVELACASQLDEIEETFETSVWVGEDVELHCGDSGSDSARRLWNRQNELLTEGQNILIDDDRISLVNGSTVLRIINVTLNDRNHYKCSAHGKPRHTRTINLDVKEKPCKAPDKPLNGDYHVKSNGKVYWTGDTITYYCNRGYQLIGLSNRTCTGTKKGWTTDEPHCETEYAVRLLRRLEDIEDKVNAIEKRWTTEGNTSSLLSFDPQAFKTKQRLIACLRDTPLDSDTVSKCMTMQWGVRNGHSVSEYKWVVEDIIDSKVPTEEKYSRSLYSPPFYHTVPGYKFRLKLDLYYNCYFNVYLMLVPSDYDDQLEWPFVQRTDLVLVWNDVNDSVSVKYTTDQLTKTEIKRPTTESYTECSIRGHRFKSDTSEFRFYFNN